jgi:hypothetical protein
MRLLRNCLWLVLVFGLVNSASARVSRLWTYKDLTEESDLIVIATPVEVADSGVKTTIPDVVRGTDPIPAIQMAASFEVLAVLKGETNSHEPGNAKVIVSYLRKESVEPPGRGEPRLLSFNPQDKNRYLLFLKHDGDGRYSLIVGQTDPADAVRDLGRNP